MLQDPVRHGTIPYHTILVDDRYGLGTNSVFLGLSIQKHAETMVEFLYYRCC